MNSLKIIMNDLNSIDFCNILSLYNNMVEPPLLENWITSQYNCAWITIMVLKMLYYAQSKHSNIIQRVNIQFAFAKNIPKQFVKLFHQMSLFIAYKSFYCSLKTNIKAVIKKF